MKYDNIKKAIFLERPNRFIAKVQIDGKEETVHVKNTGRCKELLIPEREVYLTYVDKEERKTKYDLITVNKDGKLINMDSMAPNKIFYEYINEGLFLDDITYVKPECVYKNSRFDFYIETPENKIFAEVKGVTLEEKGAVFFPDAPTERGVKHIKELIDAKKNGYEAYIVFIIQMDNVKYFSPNDKTHKEFGDALRLAKKEKVNILALYCDVTYDTIKVKGKAKIVL